MKGEDNTRQSSGSSNDLYIVPQSMKKKFFLRELFFAVYHCCRLGLAITIIVLMSQTNTQSIRKSDGFSRMQQVIQIWGKDVIVDIITTSTYNCPEGYESYTSASWPGTKQGCFCQVVFTDYEYAHVLPGQCSYKLMQAGCLKVLPKQSIPFAFWKTNKLICIKRIEGLNIFTNMSELSAVSQTQICANSTPYQIQSLKDHECPITSISNTSTAYPNILEQISFSYDREDNYPIVDLLISEYSFCIDYGKSNISPNRFENYNLQLKEIRHCEETDPRVIQIDQITEKQLFENNQRIYDLVMEELPIFPQPTDDYVYKLGVTRYPPWNIGCRKTEQFGSLAAKKVYEMEESTEQAEYALNVSIFIIVFWGFLYTVISIIRRIAEIKSREQNHILYLPDAQVVKIDPNLLPGILKLNLCGQIIVFLLLIVMAIAILVNIGVQYTKTDKLEVWMRQSQRCMDETSYLISWVNSGYISYLQQYIRNYLICIICGIVIACLDIMYSVWRLEKGDLAGESWNSLFEPNEYEHQGEKNNEDKFSDQDEKFRKDKDLNEKQTFNRKGSGLNEQDEDMRKTRQVFNPTEENLSLGDQKIEDQDQFHFERPAVGKRKSKVKGSKKKKARQLEFFDFE